MVQLEWTPRLNKAFRNLHEKTGTTSPSLKLNADESRTAQDVSALLESTEQPVCVEMDLVKRVSALLLKHSNNRKSSSGDSTDENDDASEYWIHAMIKGSSVYVPKPPPKERSPELERIMDGIKAQLAEKEYQRMVSSVDPDSLDSSSIAGAIRQDLKDMRDIKAHSIGIINVLYTGASVFTAVYMISGHFTEDIGIRVLLAFLGFVLIVACEAYLYTRHASLGNTPEASERKKRPVDSVAVTKSFTKDKNA
ncbi:endoplasmic reticulum-based factor for assembly of V-ATPase-domain-containing protein [Mortierella sp. GBAus27b]|nr:hypothetical protein BGX31_011469 [Mortierella sp. GBA43]KAI8349832.1 endoplasmic reticulum-based factor for assembly of V-ATPase-domain-containing protein [Mortierella sp. GBAus27b]